ncbi:hypothetical protein [Komagataeibacter swingsii]|nr:hypothetical protein [Komagataeibacter swingsii]
MDRGVFLVRRELQDRRQVAAQDDRQFAVPLAFITAPIGSTGFYLWLPAAALYLRSISTAGGFKPARPESSIPTN